MSDKLVRSRTLMEQAATLMPGGVNSPVRAFRGVGGTPPVIASAEGAHMTDEDGNRYIDYCGTWGPAILGHSHPEVVEAVRAAAGRGMSFGAPSAAEIEMAQVIQNLVPSMEMLRMVSSGTEACMSALRLARGFTGRDGILKFEGCYHGHADSLLVKAGSGGATFGIPNSAGVPASLAQHTYTLPYNDPHALRAFFDEKGQEIACIILEPVTGNMGVIRPSQAFLDALVDTTKSHGALLIFDEVMTGFRVALGGAQALFGVRPDLTCLGKVVGGGLPVGVYGGRRDVMQSISPLGPVYQAGTLSGNPLATAAGIKTLKILSQPGVFERAETNAEQLATGLRALMTDLNVSASVTQVGTMLTVFFGDRAPENFDEVSACDHERFGQFHRAMLDRGVYLPPSGYEAWFVSAAHTHTEIEATLNAAREALLA
ncbi:MAG: glutamate-1-semialdehyde 2,1-aminomutase [Myxococcota bacterium]|nr:glutamate-1-semialdehyde 2,1-aminomutase [Myxococcota bacterium]